MNPIRRLLCGSGRLPDALRAELEGEGMLLLREGLPGTTTYRHYRAPGERSNWRREWRTAAIAVSARRLVVWTSNGREIDVPRRGPLPRGLTASYDSDALHFDYDAGAFRDDRSGLVEVRLRTHESQRVRELIDGA